jgi:hypothetical protein
MQRVSQCVFHESFRIEIFIKISRKQSLIEIIYGMNSKTPAAILQAMRSGGGFFDVAR